MEREITLVDTDALIEYFRKNEDVVSIIDEIAFENIFITPILKAEILRNTLDKREFNKINKSLEKFTIIPIDTSIRNVFEQLIEKYTLSHRPAVPDMLIAATSAAYNIPLFTLNQRDFKFITEIRLIPHSIRPMSRRPGSWFE